jgi:citrate/tricarballylate utilization protein
MPETELRETDVQETEQETATVQEARRVMEICNACRYCEGFCAVFPAMEMQRAFSGGDLSYLANLCHNCRGCYYACQYAPPHPFGVNVPQTFALLRDESYQDHAWPRPLARAFARNGMMVALVTAAALSLVVLLTSWLVAPGTLARAWIGRDAFYRVIPWAIMTGVAAATLLFSVLALMMGGISFWRSSGSAKPVRIRDVLRGLHDALTLKNLGGGITINAEGDSRFRLLRLKRSRSGCNDRDESFSMTRRYLHHAMAYGFLACFAATCIAAFDAYILRSPAPYPLFSLPVIFGTLGGIGLLAGTSGLIWLKVTGDPNPAAKRLLGADFALLALLWLAAITGIILLAFRGTAAMGPLLAVHLGVILALFVLLPYSKFVHALYRTLALVRSAAQ